ncbi:hypothetical protein KDN32_14685 [Nocardioides sp. J2M5]|uniref:hypothetical protein n=1 Tax=Nocardioides palaemonis TaxID=2829810 RepID=UPI001BA6621D|nr:hypothetical protein [Nocardioides palaemonis]MBS2938983.1 hypothetical protein [Nocardioides palaemonis]
MRSWTRGIDPRWRGRVLGATALAAIGYGVALLLDFEPHPLPYALWWTIATAMVWLVVDTASVPRTVWRNGMPRGADRVDQASSDLRVLSSHLQANEPTGALRDRLVGLARARDPDLADELRLELDTVRRLSPADIDRILTRIEEIRD